MSLILTRIDPIKSKEWDEAVHNYSKSSFFHLSHWIKTLTDSYHYTPFCFLSKENGYTLPMVITKTLKGKKKAIALPFSDGCEIYCDRSDCDSVVSFLLERSQAERIHGLEFRGTVSFMPYGEISHSYWGHRLDFKKGVQKLWTDLSASKRRNIKKGQKEKLGVEFYADKKSLKEYYRLHCMTRKRHGLPPQPYRFFLAVYKNIISKNRGEIGLVHLGNKTVAGAVYFFSKTEALYKFGASDAHYQRLRGNDLLMWEAIRRYSEKGHTSFSFGKTEKYHEGLCRFKEEFGAERVQLNDYMYDISTGRKVLQSPKVQGVHNEVFRRMPIPMLRLVGNILYQYSA